EPNKAAQDVALDAVVHADDVVVGRLSMAVTLLDGPRRLGPFVRLIARHLARQIHPFEAGPLRGNRLQMRDVVTPSGRESETALRSALVTDTAGEAARIHTGNPDQIAFPQPLVQGNLCPPVGGRSDVFAQHETATGRAARLDIFVVGTHV